MKKHMLGLAVGQALIALSMATAGAQSQRLSEGALSEPEAATFTRQARFDRFVVKYKSYAAEIGDADRMESGLRSASLRSGLTGHRAAGVRKLRDMALPGWRVVETSRLLSEQEARDFIRELEQDPAVERADVDDLDTHTHTQSESIAMVPDDPNYAGRQWHFYDPAGGVRAEEAWELADGDGVVVAVIDTGIVENHLDLAANVLPGYDFISDSRNSRRPVDGRVAGGWDVGNWAERDYCVALGGQPHSPRNSSWHGSHVAGTIAQETNNGRGTVGLSHGAQVMPLRVLGACGGYTSDITDAITWASGGEVPGLPANEHPAEVINMSLGSVNRRACPAQYQEAIDGAIERGSIVVVAAGNDNDAAGLYTMSACDNVISVGATRITGGKASYSSYGERVDLSAPGGGGSVDGNPDGYVWQVVNASSQAPTANWLLGGKAGTSMASPHVAAVAAMVQSVAEAPLGWERMRDLLRETARPFPAFISPATPLGAGIVDARAALERVLGQDAPEALINGVRRAGVSGAAGAMSLFSFEVEAGRAISIRTLGGTGDVSLVASFGAPPTVADHEHISSRSGNVELIRIDARSARAGTYYIGVVGGTTAYDGVLVEARQ
ncbi:S8 family peptidase [Luteimonas salinilitoris]|uniref:S8 family peptidase n=1 Tax=Luteimonas salinilitoris TaxID=3237697 RepID=A0ABV4HQ85_9GAMM